MLARVSLYPPPRAAQLAAIPSGIAGVDRTLREMKTLTLHWRKDSGIWELARRIVAPLPARDFRGQIERIFHWVKQNVRYTPDIRDVETLATPKATLEVRCGDCDDMAVLLASLLESVGHPTRFVALGFNNELPSHVLVETRSGGGWLSLDPTIPSSVVGWKPRDATYVMVKHV